MIEDHLRLRDVGHAHGPARVFAHQLPVERRNLAARVVQRGKPFAEVSGGQRCAVFPLREHFTEYADLLIPWGWRVFAEDGDRLLHALRGLPQEATAGVGEWVLALAGIAASIIERPVRIFRLVGLREPLVTVGAVATTREEVIERHELLGKRVRVGRHVAAVHHELWVTSTAAERTEYLVVGAVFADDEDNVLDGARLARALGHRLRRDVSPRRQVARRVLGERQPIVLRDAGGERGALGLVRHRDHVHRAAVGVHVTAACAGMP